MKMVKIRRDYQDKTQTLGSCVVFNEDRKPVFSAISLERGWNNNKKNISCIPSGMYKVVLEYSNSFKRHLYEIKDVKDRSECKFHSANYWYQLNGCIALGEKLADINGDGYNDITSSKKTMRRFEKALDGDNEFLLIIY